MKKVLIILNILLLGIIIFQACKLKKTSITDKSLSGTETSASRDCRVDDCGRVICKDYSDVPLDGEVDAETLIKMSSDYSKDNAKSTIAGMTEPDGSA
ncbi:MAG TPA: hypothetical protein PLZ45_16945, partial [Ferruginibacter sp.]|nr:hypothetical protein [Ferruginibacter sp.]